MPPKTRDNEASSRDALLFYLLIALVALAPLPLASNLPLPAAIVSAFAGVLLILWALRLAISGRGLNVSPRLLGLPLALFAAVCIWIFIQWLPGIPASLADPAWRVAGEMLKEPLEPRISVNPGETLSGLMRVLAYGAVFWLSLQLNRDGNRAQQSIFAIAMIGCVYSLYGIAIYMTGNEWVLIYRKWAYGDSLTSTFINRNSFATFAGLCLLCAAGIFMLRIRGLLSNSRPLREKIVILIEHVVAHSRLLTVAVLSIALALALTGSRAGVALSFAALLLLVIIPTGKQGLSVAKTIGFSAGAFALMLVSMMAGGDLLSRRDDTQLLMSSLAQRAEVQRMTWEAIQTSPWTGTGFGTFPDVFTAYKTSSLGLTLFWDKAHNTYLENALELGIPAASALVFALLLLLIRCIKGVIQRRRNRLYPAIGIAATVLVGLHSWVDFSLQMPAVSILYAFLMGIAVSQSWSGAKDS